MWKILEIINILEKYNNKDDYDNVNTFDKLMILINEIENKLVRYGGQVTINKKGIVRIKLTVTVVNPDEHFKEQCEILQQKN